ncbi:hypothetical protein ACFE04_012481 [Oxalis oulophora]
MNHLGSSDKATYHDSNILELGHIRSFGRTSSAGSSLRRRSVNSSGREDIQLEDDDFENQSVSEAGDIGDRALHSGSRRLSSDNGLDDRRSVVPISENEVQIPTHITTTTHGLERKDEENVLPHSLEYVLCLLHLSFFGILGILTRYLLQKLFGPSIAHVTSDQSFIYLDLPSNLVGSFLMGWFGVVFKPDIIQVSDHLAIGLSTGYLGSLTTFSGWNQKMLDLSVDGHWLYCVLGFILGLFLAAYFIIFGVETAKGFRYLLIRFNVNPSRKLKVDSYIRHLIVMVVLLVMLGLLWSVSGTLLKEEFDSGSSEAQLWLACLVGPFGVWIRWFLARFNGRGLGAGGTLKWVPFGTLMANVSAACIMAALSTVKKAANTKDCDTIASGIQMGFLGCLSTVSTFIAEFNAMRESKYTWRAYAYALMTICPSFALGTLIYSVPVWPPHPPLSLPAPPLSASTSAPVPQHQNLHLLLLIRRKQITETTKQRKELERDLCGCCKCKYKETCSEQQNQISHLGLQLNATKKDLKQPLHALLFLVSFPAEAKLLVNHRWWIPKGMYLNGRAIEMTSILGPFFHVSALPDHTIFKSQPDVGQQCFSEATTRRPADLLSAFSTIKNVMNNLYDGLGEVLLILLKNMDTR